jgi:hypothetical protein
VHPQGHQGRAPWSRSRAHAPTKSSLVAVATQSPSLGASAFFLLWPPESEKAASNSGYFSFFGKCRDPDSSLT